MLQKIKITLFSLGALFAFALPVAVPATISAQEKIKDSLCAGANLDLTGTDANCDPSGNNRATFTQKLADIINIISIIVGVVAVIMIIYGGFRYIASGGAAEKVTGAKNTILYALIGLVIVALAQLIVRFVLNAAAVV